MVVHDEYVVEYVLDMLLYRVSVLSRKGFAADRPYFKKNHSIAVDITLLSVLPFTECLDSDNIDK